MPSSRPTRTRRRGPFGLRRRPKGRQVKKVKPCRHPKLPKTALQQKHHGQDADESTREPRPFILLSLFSYGATPLLNMTCGYFLECELQPHQTAARDAFVQCYLEALPRGAAWAKLPAQSLKDFEEGNGSKQVEAEAAFLEGSLRSMMKCLDEYFFFGTMTRLQEGQQHLLLVLQTGFGLLKADVAINRHGATNTYQAGHNTDYAYSRVRLWCRMLSRNTQSQNGSGEVRRLSFKQNVATLVHEMVHAYLRLFVCVGEQCKRNIFNTAGLTGHASTFVKLYALILQEVRKWHPELETMNKHLCIPGTAIVKKNIDVETRKRLQWKSEGRDRGLLPLRADSPRNLVRLTQELIEGFLVMSITYRRPGSSIPQREEAVENCDMDDVSGDVTAETGVDEP